MSKNKSESGAGESPAETPIEAPAPQATEPVKNWQHWVNALKADGPLARGACASVKMDFDAEVTEVQFKEALEKFGGKKINWRKA